jgi:recombination protein RecA
MAKKKTEGTDVNQDDLARAIVDDLNKKGFKSFLLNEDMAPVDVTDYISTGDPRLDLIISNKPNGGIAVGRITEINGLEGTGKSLLCGHLIAEAQKAGHATVLLDTENALYQDFFEAIGVNFNNLVFRQPDSLEEVFETIDTIIAMAVQRKDKRKILIVVDSISAISTKREMEADYNKDGWATDKAIIISKAMRKIMTTLGKHNVSLVFTQQLRMKMDAMPFGDKYTTSGGKALPYAATTRLRVTHQKQLSDKDKNVIGAQVLVKTVKNRLGPPQRSVTLDVYFDRGIDSVTSMVKSLAEMDIIKKVSTHYEYVDSHGELHEFTASEWRTFRDAKPEVYTEIYSKLCEQMILNYADKELSTENGTVIVEEGGEEE